MSGDVIVSAAIGISLVGGVYWLLNRHRIRRRKYLAEATARLDRVKAEYERLHHDVLWRISKKRLGGFFSQLPSPPPPIPKVAERYSSQAQAKHLVPLTGRPKFGHRVHNPYHPGPPH